MNRVEALVTDHLTAVSNYAIISEHRSVRSLQNRLLKNMIIIKV